MYTDGSSRTLSRTQCNSVILMLRFQLRIGVDSAQALVLRHHGQPWRALPGLLYHQASVSWRRRLQRHHGQQVTPTSAGNVTGATGATSHRHDNSINDIQQTQHPTDVSSHNDIPQHSTNMSSHSDIPQTWHPTDMTSHNNIQQTWHSSDIPARPQLDKQSYCAMNKKLKWYKTFYCLSSGVCVCVCVRVCNRDGDGWKRDVD